MVQAAALAPHVGAVMQMLDHSELPVRWAAISVVGALPPALLVKHDVVGSMLRGIQQSDVFMRWAAVRTLGRLEPTALAQHTAAFVRALENRDVFVRWSVVGQILSKLQPAALLQHVAAIQRRLEDSDPGVCRAAQLMLRQLGPLLEPGGTLLN